jgi:riboflavin transporter FmnP
MAKIINNGATAFSSLPQETKKMAQLSAINLIFNFPFLLNNSSIPGIIGISILPPHQACFIHLLHDCLFITRSYNQQVIGNSD